MKIGCFNSYALHPPWSPTRGRYTEMDQSPISNAKATLLSYSSFTIPTYIRLPKIYGC